MVSATRSVEHSGRQALAVGPGGARRWRLYPAAARLGVYTFTLWAVLSLNFALPRALPGSPLNALQDPDNSLFVSDERVRARVLAYYGLDRPWWEQYAAHLEGLARGDLGWSIRLHAPVGQIVWSRLPWTLLLVIPSLVVASAVTLAAGVEAGWARGSRLDRALTVGFTLVRTVPAFFLGVLAIKLFSVQLGLFPLAGATTPFRQYESAWEQALDVLHHWALPAGVLTLDLLGARFLLVRNSMVTVLGEPYMLVARAKGLPDRALKYRHGLRNALLPFFTAFSAQVGVAVAGAVFIETLFAYPGMGRLLFEAVGARDYPLLQGAFLVVALAVLAANLAADVLYGRLDPRTRHG
jgi:peptide/nickel transport system permease protein